MAGRPLEDAPEVELRSRAELREWLASNHARAAGVWLVSYRKSVPDLHVPYGDIVEECLCFGWVDSLPRAVDERRTKLWIAPRKPGSNWSKANKDRVARLESAGRIAPPGAAVIAAARADGSWTRLDAVEALEVPGDLALAFAARPGAQANWDAFPPSARRGILEWILNARRPETRAARIATTAELAQRNERANQWRR